MLTSSPAILPATRFPPAKLRSDSEPSRLQLGLCLVEGRKRLPGLLFRVLKGSLGLSRHLCVRARSLAFTGPYLLFHSVLKGLCLPQPLLCAFDHPLSGFGT